MNESANNPEQTGERKMSRLAVASLVFGIIGFILMCFAPLFSIPAIICGTVANSRIKRSNGMLKGKSLAATGMFLGYFAIIGFGFMLYQFHFRKPEYRTVSYQQDYEWNGVEVGTAINMPIGRIVPGGRYYTIISGPTGEEDNRDVLYKGEAGEIPKRPRFVSGISNIAVYKLPNDGTTNIVIPVAKTISGP